jgi:hypothetical protein
MKSPEKNYRKGYKQTPEHIANNAAARHGDTLDNRIENLMLFPNSGKHMSHHAFVKKGGTNGKRGAAVKVPRSTKAGRELIKRSAR